MPADDLHELKRTILDAVERRLLTMHQLLGIEHPVPLVPPPTNPFGGLAGGSSQFDTFATGYDGTLTTVAFTLDVSILTDGSSGDILTGS